MADDDIEERARSMGWRPKEEFRGPPEKWTDAAEFVRRGEEILPIVNQRNKVLEERFGVAQNELKEVKEKLAETTQVLSEWAERSRKDEERGYKRAMRELAEKRDAAVAHGDIDTFKATQAEMDALAEEQRPKPSPAPVVREESKPKPSDAPQVDPYVHVWVKENPWFLANAEAHDFAKSRHERIARENPEMSLQDNLAQVRAATKKLFPELFENARRNESATVATPSGGEGAGRRNSTNARYENMPAEARAACDRFVKQGLLTREKYVADYFAEDANV